MQNVSVVNVSVLKKLASSCIATVLAASLLIPVAYAQDQQAPPPPQDQAPPPSFAPNQLENIVSGIALYPDPLLAQMLTASTFPDQIANAARWSDEHHYLNGQQLSDAINQDQLPWDPSVLALLRFSVRPRHDGQRHELDQRSWQRRSRVTSRCDGRRPT